MLFGFRTKRGYALAPPRYVLVKAPQPPGPPLQQILVAAAPEVDLDKTIEYFLDARDVPEVASNAIILVEVVVQTYRPPFVAALPNPIRGVHFEGFFLAFVDAQSISPVFEVPR